MLIPFRGNSALYDQKYIAEMAPLLIESEDAFQEFDRQLKVAKEYGIKGISVDVWWGKVSSGFRSNWKYYDRIFELIKNNDLEIIPILSFHKCGGNVGDSVDIDIPKKAWIHLAERLGKNVDDVKSKNEQGFISDAAIPIWQHYDAIMLPMYKSFMESFRDRYLKSSSKHYVGDIVHEVNISGGPAGEFRHDAYGLDRGTNAPYPKRGNFVCYDSGAYQSFRKFVKEKYAGDNPNDWLKNASHAWTGIENTFPTEEDITPPRSFKNNRLNWKDGLASEFADNLVKTAKRGQISTYDIDFLNWYNGELVAHEKNMLNLSHQTFASFPGKFAIGFKIPDVHWQADTRLAEMASGLITLDSYNKDDPDNAYGYKNILDAAGDVAAGKNRETVIDFTGLEMDASRSDKSDPQKLVYQVLSGAKRRGLKVAGENALAGNLYNPKSWGNMVNWLNSGYDSLVLLRLSDIAGNGNEKVLGYFQEFMSILGFKKQETTEPSLVA